MMIQHIVNSSGCHGSFCSFFKMLKIILEKACNNPYSCS